MNTAIIPQNSDWQTFDFNDIPIQARLNENNTPIILADSVCKALGLKNTSKTLAALPDNEKGITEGYTLGGKQHVSYVTEAGLYRLIFRSNKPEAEVFRKKVFDEILPAIRKTGSYSITPKLPDHLDIAEQMLLAIRQNQREMAEFREHTKAEITELHEKQAGIVQNVERVVERLNDADYYTIRQWCEKQRISFTFSLTQRWGKEATALSSQRSIERKEQAEGPHMVGRYHKTVLMDVCVPKSKLHQPELL